MIELRQYQKDYLNKLLKILKSKNSCILTLPTGAGKTVMMTEWAAKMAKQGKRTLIIVDREELVFQTDENLQDVSIMKAGYDKLYKPEALIHIVMLQTAYSRQKVLMDLDFDYIFFDEVHQYYDGLMFKAITEAFPNAKVIGVSATPIDNKGYLLPGFDECINDLQLQDLIDMGFLVKPNYYSLSNYSIDLSKIKITNGDFNIEELDNMMINFERLDKIYSEWLKIAENRKTIAFCSSIKQAEATCNYFREKGVACACLHSKVNNREEVLTALKIGAVKIVFNVGILVAGFNEPSVDCIMFLNPTKILRRYIQQAGRGLRLFEGKSDCLMLDFAGLTSIHGFCNDLRFYIPAPPEAEYKYKECPECGNILAKHIKKCDVCGYEFTTEEMITVSKPKKKEIERLEKAMNLQKELKHNIYELVKEQGYKNGYAYYLFIDTLKTKKPTESVIKFFQRKMNKIEKIRYKKWKIGALKYD
jgi:superfamily II DNA or RNA helicase|nr:MAG TPA: Chromatin remodeling complex ATPase [Caudoviricetes sp.]